MPHGRHRIRQRGPAAAGRGAVRAGPPERGLRGLALRAIRRDRNGPRFSRASVACGSGAGGTCRLANTAGLSSRSGEAGVALSQTNRVESRGGKARICAARPATTGALSARRLTPSVGTALLHPGSGRPTRRRPGNPCATQHRPAPILSAQACDFARPAHAFGGKLHPGMSCVAHRAAGPARLPARHGSVRIGAHRHGPGRTNRQRVRTGATQADPRGRSHETHHRMKYPAVPVREAVVWTRWC